MKKLLFILIFLFCLACSSVEDFSYQPRHQFLLETDCPELIIDSISNKDSLKIDADYKNWNKIETFTSDSCVQNIYYIYNDSLKYTISILERDSTKNIIKYSHE